jgi:hypothetical protein
MKAFKSGIIGLMMLAGTAVSAFAGQEALQGGHDGGGGSLGTSTDEQVRAAIHWVFEDLKRPNSWLHGAHIYGPDAPGNQHGMNVLACLNLVDFCKPEEYSRKVMAGEPTMTNVMDYLKLSKVMLKTNGPCPASDKANAAASVSEFRVGADLCFSISELKKVAPSALRAEVASLLAHELSHLQGYGEEIAVQVQEAVSTNFRAITRTNGDMLAFRLRVQFQIMSAALFNAKSFTKEGKLGAGNFMMGYISGVIKVMEDMIPDGINDNTIPVARPELREELLKALSQLDYEVIQLNNKAIEGMPKAEFDGAVDQIEARTLKEVQRLLTEYFGEPR